MTLDPRETREDLSTAVVGSLQPCESDVRVYFSTDTVTGDSTLTVIGEPA